MAGVFDLLRAQLGVGQASGRDQVRQAVVETLETFGYTVGPSDCGGVELVSIRYGRVVLSAAPQVAVRLRLDVDRLMNELRDRLGGVVGPGEVPRVAVEVARPQ